MAEERWKMNETLIMAYLPIIATGPFLPELGRQRIVRRTQPEDQEYHRFVIANPAALNETALRMPAHRQRIPAVRHPVPVHARVNAFREVADRGFICVRPIEKFPRI